MDRTYTVFDIEADGLLQQATRVHCLSLLRYRRGKVPEGKTVHGKDDICRELLSAEVLVGHNILRYDIPLLRRLLGLDLSHIEAVDTLALSWHLTPERKSHGLEAWGRELGIQKPKVSDWENLAPEDYAHRCEEDVRINLALFRRQMATLWQVYGNMEGINRLFRHLAHKMDCLREQEEAGIKLDAERCRANLETMDGEFQAKTSALSALMPPNLGKTLWTRPKKMFNKDGNLSMLGERWAERTSSMGLDIDTEEIREAPSPSSTPQLKAWLEGLGWRPQTWKLSKATGGMVPQVSLPMGGGLCHSVRELFDIEPALRELEGYYVLRHRMGLLKSFLAHVDSRGRVRATAHGFANTLRLMHSAPVCNLPKPDAPLGREIREVLVAPLDGWLLCGADISALEDSTKQHFIYPYDPGYVTEMRVPGFDPHLDIAVLAGLISQEEARLYKELSLLGGPNGEERAELARLKKLRSMAKTANFAATYGAGGAKIAEAAKIPEAEGHRLHRAYWERNSAIRKVASACKVREAGGAKWLLNPVTGMWLPLRNDKDRFSTLNQSTGAYVFDTWLGHARQMLGGIPVVMQYHDEILLACREDEKQTVEDALHGAMQRANAELALNVEIGISTAWGRCYADCH